MNLGPLRSERRALPTALQIRHILTSNPNRQRESQRSNCVHVVRILVDNEECIFSQGCDLAQMWMIYHFDDITVTRADGRSLSDQNLKDIELNISEDIDDDFDEEGYELRLEFTPAADKMSLTIDFLRQY